MQTELLSVEEKVTNADSDQFRAYPFTVPDGAGALRLAFEVDPRHVGGYEQAINLSLYDPSGFRGSPGRTDAPHLGPGSAGPGFQAGPLAPGAWQAEVSLVHVLKGPPCTYRLRLWLEDVPAGEPRATPPALPSAIPGTGPGWYAGDLHMHTHHSDGHWSVAHLWEAVRERGLDFFMLTDHNTLVGQPEVAALANGRILPIPGLEVTTARGHLLALGVDAWIDWRVGRRGRSIGDVLRDIHAAGGVAIIAHPGASASPSCHGCRWDLLDVDLAQVDAVEGWNSYWLADDDNERNLLAYDAWLGRGHRVAMTGGSDEHGDGPRFAPDAPTTQVYAAELSRQGILDGIRAGHMVVTSGPTLRVTAAAGDLSGMPGDTLPAGGPFSIEAAVADLAEPARLSLAGSGGLLATAAIDGEGRCRYTSAQALPGWYRAELRSRDGRVTLAISSPFFVR